MKVLTKKGCGGIDEGSYKKRVRGNKCRFLQKKGCGGINVGTYKKRVRGNKCRFLQKGCGGIDFKFVFFPCRAGR